MKNVVFILLMSCLLFINVVQANVYFSAGMMAEGESTKQQRALKVNNSSQAAQIVKSRVGGKVLKVQTNGKSGYKVKVMKSNGHIVSLKVDAKSGRIKEN